MTARLSVLLGKREHKDLGSPLRLIFNTVAIFLLSQIAAFFIVDLGLALLHPASGAKNLFDQSVIAQFFFVLLAEGLAFLLVLRILKLRRLPLSFIGFGRKPAFPDIWKGLGGFAAFYGLLIIIMLVVSFLMPSLNLEQQQDIGFKNIVSPSDNLFALLALVILPPLGEETLMRGYLYSGLRARWRFLPALLVTSLLFGIAHLEFGGSAPLLWAAGIDTFILSVVLVYLRETTGALYAGILVHMLNNLAAFVIKFH